MTVIVDASGEAIRLQGKDRARFLHGLCTANIEKLAPGDHVIACLLNPKGRVLGFFDVLTEDDALVLLCDGDTTSDIAAALERYAIMDDVTITVEADQAYHRVWETPADVWSAPKTGAQTSSDAQDIELMRVLGGRPIYGQDISTDNFPFESTLGQFVDYEKGCYIGQEPISRVHFRGQPNKHFRGLVIQGEPQAGATIVHDSKAKAGTLTSVVKHPSEGFIGLGYLHRSCAAPGQAVTIDGCEGTVCTLPFDLA